MFPPEGSIHAGPSVHVRRPLPQEMTGWADPAAASSLPEQSGTERTAKCYHELVEAEKQRAIGLFVTTAEDPADANLKLVSQGHFLRIFLS
jgi:hypothetical protein